MCCIDISTPMFVVERVVRHDLWIDDHRLHHVAGIHDKTCVPHFQFPSHHISRLQSHDCRFGDRPSMEASASEGPGAQKVALHTFERTRIEIPLVALICSAFISRVLIIESVSEAEAKC